VRSTMHCQFKSSPLMNGIDCSTNTTSRQKFWYAVLRLSYCLMQCSAKTTQGPATQICFALLCSSRVSCAARY
jgi:hypothetical protein